MTKEERRDKFRDVCYNMNHDVDEEYSGRYMFGDTCPAVRVDYVADLDEIEAECGFCIKRDQMGLGYVGYTG